MITAFVTWHAATRHELTEVGTEVDPEGPLAEPSDGAPGIRSAAASTDWSATHRAGSSSSTSRPPDPGQRDDAQQHAQLRPLPARGVRRLLPDGDRPGGGRLLHVGKPSSAGATERDADGPRRRRHTRGGTPCSAPRKPPRGRTSPPGAMTAHALPGPALLPGPSRGPSRQSGGTGCRPGLPAPTEEQAAVIASPPGPLVVVAGAGAGKTETMAARWCGWWPTATRTPVRCWGLTFTRKAARAACCARCARGWPGSPDTSASEPPDRRRSARTTPSPARCWLSSARCCP